MLQFILFDYTLFLLFFFSSELVLSFSAWTQFLVENTSIFIVSVFNLDVF